MCDVHGVPLATNAATARAVLPVLDRLTPGLGIRPSRANGCETFVVLPGFAGYPLHFEDLPEMAVGRS